jgi:hypothetical protein
VVNNRLRRNAYESTGHIVVQVCGDIFVLVVRRRTIVVVAVAVELFHLLVGLGLVQGTEIVLPQHLSCKFLFKLF